MKHFSQVSDFTKDEYLEIFRRAKIFQDQPSPQHAELANGKVMAVMFFQESARTIAGFQSAMIKLGGGWLGITSSQGTYVEAGEEDLETTLLSVAEYADVMAVRHKTFDLSAYAPKSPIPLINGMCGGDEHSIAALSLGYSIWRRLGDLEGKRFGIYGMTKASRPAKGILKALSAMGMTFYEDSVVDSLKTPEYIEAIVRQNGSSITHQPLDQFIGLIDFFLITEGLPQPGEDEQAVNEYNKQFKVMGSDDLRSLKRGALYMYSMPAALTDGRTTIKDEELTADERMIGFAMIREMTYVTMAAITYLLDIEVKETS